MQNTEEFKNILVKLIEQSNTNMGRNQVLDKIETAYNTFKLIKRRINYEKIKYWNTK